MTGETLRRDVHPGEILMPDGTMLTSLRVFVTTHRLVAYQVRDRTIKRVVDLELVEPGSVPLDHQTLGRGRLECVTPEGTAWVNQGRGCGCGSPLKALSPTCWAQETVAV
jgi:hypothetical protein